VLGGLGAGVGPVCRVVVVRIASGSLQGGLGLKKFWDEFLTAG